MIERAVLVEHEKGSSVLFWTDHKGELRWISSDGSDSLREIADHFFPNPVEIYRWSIDGYCSQSPTNPTYGKKWYPTFGELLYRQKNIERVKRFGELLRERVPA